MATYADGAVIITIDADGKLAIKELENTEKAVKGVGDESEESKEKVGGFGDEAKNTDAKLVMLSAGAAAAAAALLSVGSAAITASSQFESAFAKTQTIMDTAAMSAYDMRSEILDLSRDSAMAATDVSEAVYQAISGSVATQDATAFVNQANQLAVAGFTSLTNATDVLTTTLNSYKLEASAVGGVSNVLIQTQNLGKTSVDELASSMGRAISTGSAYGVNLQNLATGYVELTRSGIATSEATTYLSGMLNELGDSGSKVGTILQQETGRSFGQLMQDGWSLGDVLKVLSDSVDGNAEALMGLWSSQEAGKASNAIMTQGIEDFNAVVAQMDKEMSGATGTTEQAYKTMTNTSEFIDKQLSNSINNLAIAFGDDLRPAVDGVKKLLTGIVDWAAEIVDKSPWVASAFAAITVGLGAFAVVLTAYTIKTKIATSETLKLTAAMATNPVTLAITAIAALAAGVAVYASASADATEKTEKLSAVSEQHRKKIAEMNAEYEALCETKGKTSAEAVLLKQKIDEETEAFERNKQTEEEYQSEQETFWNGIKESTDAHLERVDAMEEEYASTTSLISRLQELTEAEYQTAAAKEEILAIVDLINQRMPQLGLTYDTLTGILNLTPEQIAAAAKSDYQNRKKQEDYNRLVELYGNEEAAKQAVDAAQEENAARYQEYLDAKAEQDAFEERYSLVIGALGENYYIDDEGNTVSADKYAEIVGNTKDAKEAWEASADAYWDAVGSYNAIAGEITDLSIELSGAVADGSDTFDDASKMIDAYAEEMRVLTEAYEAAYEAAYTSISGQFELWDTAPKVAQRTVDELLAAMQSQTAYWTDYSSNLDTILAYSGQIDGLGDVVSDLGAGSQDAVEFSAAIAQALRDGDIELVKNLTQEYRNLKSAQDEASNKFADVETGYSDRVLEMAKEIASGIEELDIDQAAYDLGSLAIEQFISGADDQLPFVQEAYGLIGFAAYEALHGAFDLSKATSGGRYNPTNGRMMTYASGTNYAERGFALVGENGPELVYFRGGERVLTAEETRGAMRTVYPTAPQMAYIGAGAPAIARGGGIQLRATIAVPLEIDGRELARATAEYNGEEMEWVVM